MSEVTWRLRERNGSWRGGHASLIHRCQPQLAEPGAPRARVCVRAPAREAAKERGKEKECELSIEEDTESNMSTKQVHQARDMHSVRGKDQKTTATT